MNEIWNTPEGKAALAYANNNLALAKAFIAGYLYALPYKRKEYKEKFGQEQAQVPVPYAEVVPQQDQFTITAENGYIIDIHNDEASFEYWWNLYDKKRGKRKAFLKWKALPLYKRRDCILATPAYVKSTPDPQFRKDPQTYLNNESYYDEFIPQKQDEPRYDPYAKAASILAE